MAGGTVLMMSGSLRDGSTNTAAINTAARLIPAGWRADVFSGMGDLPHFNPDDDNPDDDNPDDDNPDDDEGETVESTVARLRGAIEASDAILVCTPEYAGALPGSFKNLLDWTVGGMEIVGKPVAWLNVSVNPSRAADAHESLRKVLGFTGADIVDAACVEIPVARGDIGEDTLVVTDDFVASAAAALRALTDHVIAAQA